ncbi:30S ribosomal protein S3, partial [Durusdinium trenchii]
MEKGTKPAVKAKGKACPSKPHSSAEPEESDADGEDREEPDAEVSASGSGGEEDLSEAAKRARLRRLCEKKGSGKLNVPEEVHLLWKKGGHTRDQLAELLEESGFEKDVFVKKVLRSKEKVARRSAKTRRGWYTVEGMKNTLQWSKPYIAGVVRYCEKSGNERLVKKDRYNKKIKKYYVEVDEEDEDLDYTEEREREEEEFNARDLKGFTKELRAGRSKDIPGAAAPESEPDSSDDEKGNADDGSALYHCARMIGRGAPCCDVVEFAKQQVQTNPEAPRVLREFAKVSINDAEKGCHRIFAKYNYIPPVEIEYTTLGEGYLKDFPFIRLSSWVQWLLDSGRLWRHFVGARSWESMQEILNTFWGRYNSLYPEHQVFQMGLDLRCVIPFFSHQDEGRTKKHDGIWIFASHGCIGRGTTAFLKKGKDRIPLHRSGLGMNFIGCTWSSHFLFCTMVRTVLEENPEAMNDLMKLYATDVALLAHSGIVSEDGTKKVHLIHLGSLGDCPALAKIVRGTKAINVALSFAYQEGFFILACHGRKLAQWMM